VKTNPPLNERIAPGATSVVSPGWSNFFTALPTAISWTKGFNQTATIDFPNTLANAQSNATVTVIGARAGDAVQVSPLADVSGIIFTGVVTANDTVTVYAKNFTVAAINPASQIYRIVVLQN